MIRQATVRDAGNLAALMMRVDGQSDFMMFEAGERTLTAEQLEKRIISVEKQSNLLILIAEEKEDLIGYMFAIGGTANKNRHSAYLVIGIDEAFTGKGLGTEFFAEMEKWARSKGLHRLELTVVSENGRAVALYKKMGFKVEGTKKDSLFINGTFVNEYYMGKLLN
ncbi:N-acetyltransferase family protein [Falsibacillus pallidus]|uniref:GNAT family N-acetyltransferase n=1 Tax=Falsibacillus pallidus TaxID=493781 RepID=UPI003D999861